MDIENTIKIMLKVQLTIQILKKLEKLKGVDAEHRPLRIKQA